MDISQELDIEGSKTLFAGEGQPLVFIHGTGENHKIWKHQISHFRKTRMVVAPDFPGHGDSRALEGEVSILSYSEHLMRVLDALNLNEATLIGHSMGGAIALTLALNHPERVKALGLVNSGAKLGVLPEILDGLKNNFEGVVKGVIFPRYVYHDSDRRLVQEMLQQVLSSNPDVVHQDYAACSTFDVRNRLTEIEKPTLIVAGEDDRLTPVKWSTYLNENIYGSKLVVVKKAAHLVMLEKSEEFNVILKNFLEPLGI
ncbi:MAG: alpha/beta hydrolase [Thaumarchaeota archaeon]|nr:alpha/beta hydrolase [Nitrososphaerota archaeon]